MNGSCECRKTDNPKRRGLSRSSSSSTTCMFCTSKLYISELGFAALHMFVSHNTFREVTRPAAAPPPAVVSQVVHAASRGQVQVCERTGPCFAVGHFYAANLTDAMSVASANTNCRSNEFQFA